MEQMLEEPAYTTRCIHHTDDEETLEVDFNDKLNIDARTPSKVSAAKQYMKDEGETKMVIEPTIDVQKIVKYFNDQFVSDMSSIMNGIVHIPDSVLLGRESRSIYDTIDKLSSLWNSLSKITEQESISTIFKELNAFINHFSDIINALLTVGHVSIGRDDTSVVKIFESSVASCSKYMTMIRESRIALLTKKDLDDPQISKAVRDAIQPLAEDMKQIIQFTSEQVVATILSLGHVFLSHVTESINSFDFMDVNEKLSSSPTLGTSTPDQVDSLRGFGKYKAALMKMITFSTSVNNQAYSIYRYYLTDLSELDRDIIDIIDKEESKNIKQEKMKLDTDASLTDFVKREMDRFELPTDLYKRREHLVKTMTDCLNGFRKSLNLVSVKNIIMDMFFDWIDNAVSIYENNTEIIMSVQTIFASSTTKNNGTMPLASNFELERIIGIMKDIRAIYQRAKVVVYKHDDSMSHNVRENKLKTRDIGSDFTASILNSHYNLRRYVPIGIQIILAGSLHQQHVKFFKTYFDVRFKSEQFWKHLIQNSNTSNYMPVLFNGLGVNSSEIPTLLADAFKRKSNDEENKSMLLESLESKTYNNASFYKEIIKYGLESISRRDNLIPVLLRYSNNISESGGLETLWDIKNSIRLNDESRLDVLLSSFTEFKNSNLSDAAQWAYAIESIIKRSKANYYTNDLQTIGRSKEQDAYRLINERMKSELGLVDKLIENNMKRDKLIEELSLEYQRKLLGLDVSNSPHPRKSHLDSLALDTLTRSILFMQGPETIGYSPYENRSFLFDALFQVDASSENVLKYRFRSFIEAIKTEYNLDSELIDTQTINDEVDKTCFAMAVNSHFFDSFIVKVTLHFISEHFSVEELKEFVSEVTSDNSSFSSTMMDSITLTYLKNKLSSVSNRNVLAYQKMEREHILQHFGHKELGETEETYESEIKDGVAGTSVPRVISKYRRLLVDCLKTNKDDTIMNCTMNAICVSFDELIHRNSTYKVNYNLVHEKWLNMDHDATIQKEADKSALQKKVFAYNERNPIEKIGTITNFAEFESGYSNKLSNWSSKYNFGFNTMLSLSPLSRIDQNEATGFNYYNLSIFTGDVIEF